MLYGTEMSRLDTLVVSRLSQGLGKGRAHVWLIHQRLYPLWPYKGLVINGSQAAMSDEHHQIAPLVLRAIECGIGLPQQFRRGLRVLWEERHSDGDTQVRVHSEP